MKAVVLKYYPFAPLLLLCIYFAYKAVDFPVHDFGNYYFGGQFLADGNFNSDIYFPYEFNKMIAGLGHQDIFLSYAPNTPFLAFFFLPFSLLGVAMAKLVFNCISIALFIISIYRLFSFYKINPKYALLIPVLFLIPIKNNLLFGQTYFLLFFLLSEGWLAYEKEYWKPMAAFWGLAILLKVFPVLIFVFLAFKKKGSYIFGIVIFCIVFLGASLFFIGIDIWGFYLSQVLPKASNGEIAGSFVDNYQSVLMFLKRMLVYDKVENPNAFFNYPVLFSAILLAFKMGVLCLGFFVTRMRFNGFYAFSFWIVAMVLLSPYASTYGFILFVFSFLALLQSEISNVKKIILGLLLFLICNLPLSIFIENQFPVSYLRLMLVLGFFVFFLMQFRHKMAWKITTLLFLITLGFGLVFKKSDTNTSHIYLEKAPMLMYDLKVDGVRIRSHFWDDKGGGNIAIIDFPYKKVESLQLKDNQVFYKNRQLTFDKSNKQTPILVDGRTVFYLSDYERGIGFFTLRKINLQ